MEKTFKVTVNPFDIFGFHLSWGIYTIVLHIMWFEITYYRKNPVEGPLYIYNFVNHYKDDYTLEIIYYKKGWGYGFWVSTYIGSINIDIGPIGIFGWYRWSRSKEYKGLIE